MFQFQYGAIKGRNYRTAVALERITFQFQYGAIKGCPADAWHAESGYVFQFQYGAIKGRTQQTPRQAQN